MKKTMVVCAMLLLMAIGAYAEEPGTLDQFSWCGLYGNYYVANEPMFNIWVGNLGSYGDVMGLYSGNVLIGYAFLNIVNITSEGALLSIATGQLYTIDVWGNYGYCADLKLKYTPPVSFGGISSIPEKRTIRLYGAYGNLVYESYLVPF